MLERLELKEGLFSSLIKRNKGRYQGNMKELKLILLIGLLEMEGNLIHWVPTTYGHLKMWSLKFLFCKNPLGHMLLFHVSETSDLAGIVSFCVPHLCCLSTQDLSRSVTGIAPEGHTHLAISTFSPHWKTMDRMCFSWPLLCVSASRFLHPLSSTVNWMVCVQSQMEPWTWILLPSHCSCKDVLVPKSGRCRVGLDAIKDACLSKILCFHVVTPAHPLGPGSIDYFPFLLRLQSDPLHLILFFLPTNMFHSLLFQSPRAQIQKGGKIGHTKTFCWTVRLPQCCHSSSHISQLPKFSTCQLHIFSASSWHVSWTFA